MVRGRQLATDHAANGVRPCEQASGPRSGVSQSTGGHGWPAFGARPRCAASSMLRMTVDPGGRGTAQRTAGPTCNWSAIAQLSTSPGRMLRLDRRARRAVRRRHGGRNRADRRDPRATRRLRASVGWSRRRMRTEQPWPARADVPSLAAEAPATAKTERGDSTRDSRSDLAASRARSGQWRSDAFEVGAVEQRLHVGGGDVGAQLRRRWAARRESRRR